MWRLPKHMIGVIKRLMIMQLPSSYMLPLVPLVLLLVIVWC
jgi:hypothetical protein